MIYYLINRVGHYAADFAAHLCLSFVGWNVDARFALFLRLCDSFDDRSNTFYLSLLILIFNRTYRESVFPTRLAGFAFYEKFAFKYNNAAISIPPPPQAAHVDRFISQTIGRELHRLSSFASSRAPTALNSCTNRDKIAAVSSHISSTVKYYVIENART